MDKLSVIGKIGTILSDLQKQQEFFTKHPDSLNEVEVELFAASASYLAEYAKVLKKFPVSRMGTPLVPPQAAAQAVTQEDEDDIGFRLSFEEDEKKIHQPDEAEVKKPQVAATAPPQSKPDTSSDAAEQHGPSPDELSAFGSEQKQEASSAKPPTSPAEVQAAVEAGNSVTDPVKPVKEPSRPAPADPAPPQDAEPTPREDTRTAGTADGEAERPEFGNVLRAEQQREAKAPEINDGPTEPGTPRRMSLNERFGEKKSTLYERIVPEQQKQSSQTPLTNLGRSIGINERYYFIKTLFQDDKVAFDQAITRIDMCHSLGEALEYSNKSLAGKYSWNRKEEDARKFYDLLKRRFV